MVVIAIISLLVSILLPSLNKAKDMARMVVCLTNLHQLHTAFSLYADENEEYVVRVSRGESGASYHDPWPEELFPYAGETKEVFKCPVDDKFLWKGDPVPSGTSEGNRWPFSMSYGYNAWHVGWHWASAAAGYNDKHLRIGEITEPDKTVLFADTCGDWITKEWRLFLPRWSYSMDPRHMNNVGMVFVNGAAEHWYNEDYFDLGLSRQTFLLGFSPFR